MITIWFDFPSDRLSEYQSVVPQLQIPQIEAEFRRHANVLLKYGLGWSVQHRLQIKLYGTAEDMPEVVFTAMLKQLAWHRRAEDEARRVLALSQFQEARPSIERRLKALKDRESSMEPGAYLLELSNIAFDLFDLGGRASARSFFHSRFLQGFDHLQVNDRIRIGIRLLEVLVHDGQDFEATQLIERLAPSLQTLPQDDDRKREYARLAIKALVSACAYLEAKSAIQSALQWAPQPETAALTADLVEIELLQGDIEQSEGT